MGFKDCNGHSEGNKLEKIKIRGRVLKKDHVPACCSVVISTNPELPGVWSRKWTEDELAKAWKEFKAALILWKSINNYESGSDEEA